MSEQRAKRPTIKQLAEHTGLSPAAVSYALRGIQVSRETEARVRAAADELGFRSDPIARALRGGKTNSVGMLVASLADLYTQELVAQVQRELRAVGHQLLIADSDGDAASEIPLALGLADRRVDALIAIPIQPFDTRWQEVSELVPLVAVGDRLEAAATAGEVVIANDLGVQLMLEHLAALGHTRIAVLSWRIGRAPLRRAEEAVEAQAARLGIDVRLEPCEYSFNGSRPLARELLAAADRPSAIFALSDSIALGAYAACRELGLRIPHDVSIAGYDDHPVAQLLDPPLTSIRWATERVARIAVKLALGAIEEVELERSTIVPPVLIERRSTGPAGVR